MVSININHLDAAIPTMNRENEDWVIPNDTEPPEQEGLSTGGISSTTITVQEEQPLQAETTPTATLDDVHVALQKGDLPIIQDFILANPTFMVDTVMVGTDGKNMLHCACMYGHCHIVEFILNELHANVNRKTCRDGKTPLHLACQFGWSEIVRVLLLTLEHADLTTKQNNGWTALHVACGEGHLDIVQLLLQHDGSSRASLLLEVPQNDDWTPLHIATRHGHAHIVQYLVGTAGADTNRAALDGRTALHFAACEGNVAIVQYLSSHCDIHLEAPKFHYWTAMHCAVRFGHLEIVQCLLRQGTITVPQFVNQASSSDGTTALHLACTHGHFDIAQFLLTDGAASVGTANQRGLTAIHLASVHGHLDIVQLIVETTATPDVIKVASIIGRKSALHHAIQYDHFDIVKYLLAHGGFHPDDARNSDGMTYLLFACVYGKEHVVRFLIETYGTNVVEARTKDSWMGLHLASGNGHLNVVKVLLEDGKADVNALNVVKVLPEDGRAFLRPINCLGWSLLGLTALHLASRYGHLEVVEFLIRHGGADVNAATQKYGATALHLAAMNGYTAIVHFLVVHGGANLEAQMHYHGLTVLHIAGRNGNIEMIKLLRRLGACLEKRNHAGKNPFEYVAENVNVRENKTHGDLNHFPFNDDVIVLLSPTANNNVLMLNTKRCKCQLCRK